MLFNSLVYIFVFLPLVFILYYYVISKRLIVFSKAILVIASLLFYAWWNIDYLSLILISICVNYAIGSEISKVNEGQNNRIKNKSLLIFGIVFDISALAYFKYFNFILDNINLIFSSQYSFQKIALPLAISFFTFQQIAYLVDSYHGITKEYDFLTYALFVCFFPQLIAGPIVTHGEMIPQFKNTKNLAKNYRNYSYGIIIFLIGLFKKVVIADHFAQFATLGFDEIKELTIFGGWFTSLSYTIQIYFDFSGYCDMAMGSALFFNINLPINFNSPYKALNIADFWRRWHMTLTRFLKNYVYIPLGGNRVSELRTYLNIFIIYLISGIWHGAAWTFIVWGILHGFANIICRLWSKTSLHLPKWIAWLITFNFINCAWVLFRAKTFGDAIKIFKSMVDFSSIAKLTSFHAKDLFPMFNIHSKDYIYLIFILIMCVTLPNSIELLKKIKFKSEKMSIIYGSILGFVMLGILIKMIVIPYSEFIYFNF
ncbi:MAG: MBOAT family protein [Alphaproteobacteria bacterium]|nr:MBOAT family protein [Alphaproteobacteria bacterium]